MKREVYLVRSEVLAGFDDVVNELGSDPEPLYNQVGLTSKLLENPDHLVPTSSVCALLDIAAKELGRSDFGLMLGARRKVFQIGLLWPLIAHCPSLEQALKTIMKHFHLHNRGLLWQWAVEENCAMLTRSDRGGSEGSTFQWAVYSMCAMFGGMRALCGNDWRPSAVTFIHPKPVNSELFNQFFKVKVEFDKEFDRIVFPSMDLKRELPHHNRNLHSQLNKQVQVLEDEYLRQENFLSRVKLLVEKRIHTTDCTQTDIARALGMHPKAMQRKLKKIDVTFRELKAEVRLDVAEHYLMNSEIPLTTIAYILGFSELSSFSHSFVSRHKISPAVWREKAKDTN